MEYLGLASVASITVIAYLIGEAVKVSPVDRQWIPIICGVSGGLLGAAAMVMMPDYPAHDWITAVAVGILSGLAATGANEAMKKLTGG